MEFRLEFKLSYIKDEIIKMKTNIRNIEFNDLDDFKSFADGYIEEFEKCHEISQCLQDDDRNIGWNVCIFTHIKNNKPSREVYKDILNGLYARRQLYMEFEEMIICFLKFNGLLIHELKKSLGKNKGDGAIISKLITKQKNKKEEELLSTLIEIQKTMVILAEDNFWRLTGSRVDVDAFTKENPSVYFRAKRAIVATKKAISATKNRVVTATSQNRTQKVHP